MAFTADIRGKIDTHGLNVKRPRPYGYVMTGRVVGSPVNTDNGLFAAMAALDFARGALLSRAGVEFEMVLPHVAFHRQIGVFSAIKADPQGNILSDADWNARRDEWLPSGDDGAFIQSLMKPCFEPGKYASWIAPPKVGIDNKPGDFEYVKLHMA